jgi:hypothetical protein
MISLPLDEEMQDGPFLDATIQHNLDPQTSSNMDVDIEMASDVPNKEAMESQGEPHESRR